MEHRATAAAELLGHVGGVQADGEGARAEPLDHRLGQLAPVGLRLLLVGDELVDQGARPGLDLEIRGGEVVHGRSLLRP